MMNLVVNEIRKLVFRRSFIVYLVMLFALVGLVGVLVKYSYNFNSDEYYVEENGVSVQKFVEKGTPIFGFRDDNTPITSLEERTTISRDNYLAVQANRDESYPNELISAKKELDYYEVYLRQGIVPITTNNGGESAGAFFAGMGGMLSVVNMVVVIVASMIVASEFNGGTIKLLLIRPYKRSQILFSKLIVCLLFAAFVTVFTMISAAIIGMLLFPIQSFMLPASISTGGTSALKAGFILGLTNYLLLIVYTSIALMISAVFRSQALAVGIGMLVVFSSSLINVFLSMLIPKLEPLKWLIFNLLNVNDLGKGFAIPGELSLLQTSIGLLVYSGLFYLIADYIFKKRDVALS